MSIGVGQERLLAEGPVAKVYAARLDGAEVAVKVFDGTLDRNTSAWLDRERKAIATVRGERAILPIDDVLEFPDGRTGVRMELCQGSLAGLLGAPLPVSDVLAVGWTVAAALAAAHQVGIVHGGVTPNNVLFRPSGELAFADFGLALRRRFSYDPLRAVDYAAPETLREDTLSEASDLYGLGAVLYTALTGSSPFPGHTGQQQAERILQVFREPVPPIRVPEAPPALTDLIGRLLAKDPGDRPQDPALVAESLERMYRASTGQVEIEFDDFAGALPPQPRARTFTGATPPPGHAFAGGSQPPPGHTFTGAAQQPPVPQSTQAPQQPTGHTVIGAAPQQPPSHTFTGTAAQHLPSDTFTGTAPQPPPGHTFTGGTQQPPGRTFAGAAQQPPVRALSSVPGRTLVHTFDGAATARRGRNRPRTSWWPAVIAGSVAVVAGLIAVPLLTGQQHPAAQRALPVAAKPSPVPAPPPAPAPDVHLVLAAPADLGTTVQLNWSADANLDFAVVVGSERLPPMTLVANHEHTMSVPVDPARKYCFQIRATDSTHIYQTAPVPIRGAVCTS